MIRPLHDRVIVELEPEKNKSRGGIILLGHDTMRIGKVLRVGPGKQYEDRYVPTDVKPGERVTFMQACIETRSEAQVNYQLPDNQAIIREPDILFVVEDDDDIDIRK